MVEVWRYKKFDITIDDYRYSTRMATPEWIDRIEAEKIANTEAEIDPKFLIDSSYTKKEFDPSNPT